MTRSIEDGDFFPFGRDISDDTKKDISDDYEWPEDYENISISMWSSDQDIKITVSDDPTCVTGSISLITLLKENFRDSSGEGSYPEKIAFEKLRTFIDELIAIRVKELEDYPDIVEDGWPCPEWLMSKEG